MTQTPLLETQHSAEFLVSYATGHRSFDRGTLIAGQNLYAGNVLGQILYATPSTPTVVGTGTGTMSAISLGSKVKLGSYSVKMSGATTFNVTDPNGVALTPGTALGAYTDLQINFTLTAGGTAFVAGDTFTIVVAAGSLKYTSYVPANTDGSGVVAGILYGANNGNVNATSGDVKCTIVTRQAEVNASELKWDSSVTGAALTTGIAGLAAIGIIAR